MTRDENAAAYYLHVGLPKTGTTFIQDQLRLHRDTLRAHGVLYPKLGPGGRFFSALDARDLHTYAGVHRHEAAGRWRDFVARTRGFAGSVVFSHEILGAPEGDRPPTALREIAGHDTHIVVTARDPARQLISAWQQKLRYKSSMSFDDFLDQAALDPQSRFRRHGFRNQHLDTVLRAWAEHVPIDRIHVLTVPPANAPAELLWRRFCTALRLEPQAFPTLETDKHNASLGVGQLEHLRRLNSAVDDRITDLQQARYVRGFLVDRLTRTMASPKPALPAYAYDKAQTLADRWIAEIDNGGYQVLGDLDDLRPQEAVEAPEPGDWAYDQLATIGAETSAELLIAYTETQAELAATRAALAKERARLKHLRRAYRAVRRMRHRIRIRPPRARGEPHPVA